MDRMRAEWRAGVALALLGIAIPCGADRLPVYWGTFGSGTGAKPQAIIEVPGEPQPWIGNPGEIIEGSGYKLISIGKDATTVTLEQVGGERRRIDVLILSRERR